MYRYATASLDCKTAASSGQDKKPQAADGIGTNPTLLSGWQYNKVEQNTYEDSVQGTEGQEAVVRTGWILPHGSREAHLTTLYVKR